MMLFINFKTIFHLQKRKKALSLISIFGIVLGYICFFLVLSYCWYEKSYDKFHENAGSIYRLAYSRYDQQTLQYETPNGFYPIGNYLKENAPGVINSATIARNYNITVSTENSKGQPVFFNEEKTYYASSSLLSIFSFPIVQGKAADLDLPNTVFITQRTAKKYFGITDPLGKIIKVNGKTQYTVAGILKDLPPNTHLKFDFLFSMQTHLNKLGPWVINHWYGYDLFYTYIQLKQDADPLDVEKMLPLMVEKNYGEKLAAANQRDIFYIQPLTSIHLNSKLEWETEKPGNGDAVNILIYFSVFVLLITWINNINLISAQAVDRAKEVGVRKTLGGSRWSVIVQLALEIVTVNIFSIGLASVVLLLAYLFFPVSSVFPAEVYSDFRFWLVITGSIVLGIIVTSVVPPLSTSRFNPSDVLKGKLVHTYQGIFLRKVFIAFQFIISFILITGALIIYQQGIFLTKKNRGLNNSSVVAVKFPKILAPATDVKEKTYVFKEKIKSLAWVKDYTIATDMPEREIETFGNIYRKELGPQDIKAYFRVGGDDNYFKFFKVKLLAGRFLSKDIKSDSASIILNVSGVKKLGYSNPSDVIGKIVQSKKKDCTIVGVVQDFHYRSVKIAPVATMFTFQEKGLSYFAMKLDENDQDIKNHLTEVNKIYSDLFPGNPFEYFFLEDEMKKDLQTDLVFARIFGIFSLMSILISLIGLLGLVIVNLNQRVKELGIRKVIGASFTDISLLILKLFTAPITVALLIGIPVSIWGFSQWISTYYIYHIPISWWYFVIPAIFLPIMAISVITFQVFRVNRQKVINSLKYE